jgi:hypothetical protein
MNLTADQLSQVKGIIESRDISGLTSEIMKLRIATPVKIVILLQVKKMNGEDLARLFSYLEKMVTCVENDPENGFNTFIGSIGLPSSSESLFNVLADKQ